MAESAILSLSIADDEQQGQGQQGDDGPPEEVAVDETITFDLLSLPDVVIEVLLVHIAASGLQSLLKLRSLCQTTKSWVDDSPPPRARSLFSRAQISLDSDVKIIERFLESPPPLPIPSLLIYITHLRDTDMDEPLGPHEERVINAFAGLLTSDSPENQGQNLTILDNPLTAGGSKELWMRFCDYWSPRLLALRLEKKNPSETLRPAANREIACVVGNLLNSPHVRKVNFVKNLRWVLVPPYPPSFSRLTEISTGSILGWPSPLDFSKKFFSTLKNNPNLRRVSLEFENVMDLELIHYFVNANLNNKRLELSLKGGNDEWVLDESFGETGMTHAFIRLVKVMVNSELRIRLHLSFSFKMNEFFRKAQNKLGGSDYWKFVHLIESFGGEKPPEASLMEFHNLDNLKNLDLYKMVRGDQMQFPPRLVTLKYTKSFPQVESLPVSLKDLTLDHLCRSLDDLDASLKLLSAQCVNLERLKLTWFSNDANNVIAKGREDNKGDGDHASRMFPGLKSLSLKGYDQDTQVVRELLINRLELDQMPLLHLAMSFHSRIVYRLDHEQDEDTEDVELTDAEWQQREEQISPEDLAVRDIMLQRSAENRETPGRHPFLVDNLLALLDKDILTCLCDGLLGQSLLFMEIPEESVASDGIPEFEKLKSNIAANMNTRIEKEGRGPWLHQYPLQLEYYRG